MVVIVSGSAGGEPHRIGDGWHRLPAQIVEPQGPRPLTSEGCILLLFIEWAYRRNVDPVEIYSRANPDEEFFRTDLYELFVAWTEIPAQIELELLKSDLTDINEHRLVQTLDDVAAGRWKPGETFTHWVVPKSGVRVGEARSLDPPATQGPDAQGQHFCYVRLFAMPDCAEWGYSNAANLRLKRSFKSPPPDVARRLPGSSTSSGTATE